MVYTVTCSKRAYVPCTTIGNYIILQNNTPVKIIVGMRFHEIINAKPYDAFCQGVKVPKKVYTRSHGCPGTPIRMMYPS